MRLVLASSSSARAGMLRAAGVEFDTARPAIAEETLRRELGAAEPAAVAQALADAKALAVAAAEPDALVIGADQVLVLDRMIVTKPADEAAARWQLMRLRGRRHTLISAAACARGGAVVWRASTSAELTMRDFSTDFLDGYLAATGKRVTSTVGGYEIEGLGIQLFSRVAGDLFTIQGLPLLELLECLRSERLIGT